MVKLLNAGKAQGVIMHKIDRSARNLRDWATVGDLQDAGIDVHFAAESVDFASRGGRLTADIQAVIAADYIRNLREETIKGINGRLKQGLYPFKAPIGYVDNGGGEIKTICPKVGPLVKRLFELYASGEHSLNSLVVEANAIGLRNTKGGLIGKTVIENLLANPFYIGLIHMKKRNKIYQGKHTPLISTYLFESVAQVRAGKYEKKKIKHQFTFRRLFKCDECKKAIIGERQKHWVYYRCHTARCPSVTFREEEVAGQISSSMLDLCLSKTATQYMRHAITRWGNTHTHRDNSGLLEIEKQKIEAKKEQLLDAFLDQTIDKETYNQRHGGLLVQECGITERQKNLSTQASLPARAENTLELFKNLYVTYSLANSGEKRQLVEILYANRFVRGKNLGLEPREWVIEARNALTVLFGPPEPDTKRSGLHLGEAEIRRLETVIKYPELQELMPLSGDILGRRQTEQLTESVTEDVPRIDQCGRFQS
jgi:hypothetical protein